jgi:hypothetical protein
MALCPNCGRTLSDRDDRQCPFCGAVLGASSDVPPPPGLPPPLPGRGAGTPWERRSEIGLIPALVETTKAVLFSPTAFFRAMPVSGGIGAPLGYGVILAYLGILLQAVYQAVFRVVMGTSFYRLRGRSDLGHVMPWLEGGVGFAFQVIFGPVIAVVCLFIGAGIYHLMLMLLGAARRDYETTFRVAAYSQAASIFAVVPGCGSLIVFVWWIVVATIGLSEAHGIGRGQALAAVLLPLLLVCCCCSIGLAVFFGGIASLAGMAR